MRLWILNSDNNKNDASHYAATEGVWGSKVRSAEREIRSRTRSRISLVYGRT